MGKIAYNRAVLEEVMALVFFAAAFNDENITGDSAL